MAVIRSILGEITGSAGGVTFRKRAGQNVLQQKVGKNPSSTPAQQEVRGRLALLGQLYKQLRPQVAAVGKWLTSAAFTRLNFAAVAGPDLNQVDLERLALSAGLLEPVVGLQASHSMASPFTIAVRWQDNSAGPDALASDQVYLVLLELGQTPGIFTDGTSLRGDGMTTLQVPVGFSVGYLHAFAFRAGTGQMSATAFAVVTLTGGQPHGSGGGGN